MQRQSARRTGSAHSFARQREALKHPPLHKMSAQRRNRRKSSLICNAMAPKENPVAPKDDLQPTVRRIARIGSKGFGMNPCQRAGLDLAGLLPCLPIAGRKLNQGDISDAISTCCRLSEVKNANRYEGYGQQLGSRIFHEKGIRDECEALAKRKALLGSQQPLYLHSALIHLPGSFFNSQEEEVKVKKQARKRSLQLQKCRRINRSITARLRWNSAALAMQDAQIAATAVHLDNIISPRSSMHPSVYTVPSESSFADILDARKQEKHLLNVSGKGVAHAGFPHPKVNDESLRSRYYKGGITMQADDVEFSEL
ncbi:hypothetical protein CYMTET_13525 [Cymbomonas tetramitiformis]|uniref:Uncharacterized protein n=1 Tax=Cymbomonas tetramitiformis TaxID=36881 RepID=A0AAE0GI84_9CHLO|nr:hypothetical protein CYMTET_13525 [Cymbomonas tetramitiformis]